MNANDELIALALDSRNTLDVIALALDQRDPRDAFMTPLTEKHLFALPSINSISHRETGNSGGA